MDNRAVLKCLVRMIIEVKFLASDAWALYEEGELDIEDLVNQIDTVAANANTRLNKIMAGDGEAWKYECTQE